MKSLSIQNNYDHPQIVTLFDINPCGCVYEILTPTERYRTVRYGGELEFSKMIIDSLKSEDIFYDIGASLGLISIHGSMRCQRVFAFEPDPYYQQRLSRNISLNNKNNIEILNWAVSKDSGSLDLYTSGSGGSSPCLNPIGHEQSVLVNANSIDNAIAEGLMPPPDIIKIDIEGAEADALKGMKNLLLSNYAPRKIFIEIHPHMLLFFNSTEEEVFERLRESGYVLLFISQREAQLHAVFSKVDLKNVSKGRSTSTYKGPPFSRKLSKYDKDIFSHCWKHALKTKFYEEDISRLEHEVIEYEKKTIGRLAGDIQDSILRILVADSLNTDILNILEIGVLFGVNAICLYKLTNCQYTRKHITLVDPLHGYYQPGEMDCLTKLPVDRDTLESNLSVSEVPSTDYTIIQGVSDNPSVIRKVSNSYYQVVFIDGDHSYEGIKKDYDNYSGLIAENGYLIFDNYQDGTSPDVDRFIDELLESDSPFVLVGISWRTVVFRRESEDLLNVKHKYSALKKRHDCQKKLIEKLLSSPIEYFRYKRDKYNKNEEVYQSLESAESVLKLSPDPKDFEKFYHIGLLLHDQNDLSRAADVYEKVASDERVNSELSAWAFFKHGELFLDRGDEENAKVYFKEALMRNPKHAKASIYTVPKDAQLRVVIGDRFNCYDCIEVTIELLDGEMWNYYFDRRKPDYIEIRVDCMTLKKDWGKLIEILKENTASGGQAMIRCTGNNAQQVVESLITGVSDLNLHFEVVDDKLTDIIFSRS